MNEKDKQVLMKVVVSGTVNDVKNAFKKHFSNNDSYFGYKLLQTALKRNDQKITYFLLHNTSYSVNNPAKVNAEETLLHLAVKSEDQNAIRELMNKGVSMSIKNKTGQTPLIAAFKNKKLKAVRALLNHYKPDCKPNVKDEIIHFQIACVTNHWSAAKCYLKLGFNPNDPLNLDSEEYSGLNPVQFAAEKNYFTLLNSLLFYGGDLSVKNAEGLTPLHAIYYTCSATNSEKIRIKQIFDIGNNTKFVNAEDNDKVSHFHLSCTLNDPDVFHKFMDKGADVNGAVSSNCQINPGFTPLHFAVTGACDKVVELLLKNGANYKVKDKGGKTPLHLACKLSEGYRKLRIIQTLLNYKANPTTADNEGYTPLHMEFYFANNENKNRILEMLFRKISEKTNYTNSDGLSHFHIACTTKDINQVKDFLDSGVNVDSCVSSGVYSGYTALHFAVLHNQREVVELLLTKNAQVNVKTKEFQVTPLHLACELNYPKFAVEKSEYRITNFKYFPITFGAKSSNCANQIDIIKLLLSNGAHVNAKDYQGITPLLHTCMIDSNYCKLNWSIPSINFKKGLGKEVSTRIEKIITILISKKAQVNIYSNNEESILHLLSKYCFLVEFKKLITLILSKGVDIHAVDVTGRTPLHVAVEARNLWMVKQLLDLKANVNIKCNNGKIPLHGLFSDRSKSSIKYQNDKNCTQAIFCALLNEGSDVNILVGARNNTLLDIAINSRLSNVKKLLSNGADINLENSAGNSCISSLLEWEFVGEFGDSNSDDSDDSDEEYVNYNLHSKAAELFQIISIHVQKLLALGFHVSNTVQTICRKLYPRHRRAWLDLRQNRYNKLIDLDNILEDCDKEIQKLKITKIDSFTSLYNVLLKDEHQLIQDVKNDNFIKIIEDKKMDKDFPLYHDLLELQFRRGIMRSSLRQIAKETVFLLVNNLISVNLPDLCCDVIVKNLKNEDLANLKAVVLPKRSLKRKLSDDNDSSPSKRNKIEG